MLIGNPYLLLKLLHGSKFLTIDNSRKVIQVVPIENMIFGRETMFVFFPLLLSRMSHQDIWVNLLFLKMEKPMAPKACIRPNAYYGFITQTYGVDLLLYQDPSCSLCLQSHFFRQDVIDGKGDVQSIWITLV